MEGLWSLGALYLKGLHLAWIWGSAGTHPCCSHLPSSQKRPGGVYPGRHCSSMMIYMRSRLLVWMSTLLDIYQALMVVLGDTITTRVCTWLRGSSEGGAAGGGLLSGGRVAGVSLMVAISRLQLAVVAAAAAGATGSRVQPAPTGAAGIFLATCASQCS